MSEMDTRLATDNRFSVIYLKFYSKTPCKTTVSLIVYLGSIFERLRPSYSRTM